MGEYVAAANMAMSMLGAKKQASAQNAAIRAQQQNQTNQLQRSQTLRERQQRAQLRREQASKRARFGAAGVSSVGGSAQALLNGLASEAEQNISEQRAQSKYQIDSINRNAAYKRRVNLLEYKKGMMNNMMSLGSSIASGMKSPGGGKPNLLTPSRSYAPQRNYTMMA